LGAVSKHIRITMGWNEMELNGMKHEMKSNLNSTVLETHSVTKK